jgi:hypothetical protein
MRFPGPERTRVEAGHVALAARLRAAVGGELAAVVAGAGRVRGRLIDAGPGWLLLAEEARGELLVPAHAVVAVTGLPGRAEPETSEVARRLDLRWALRGLVRDRAAVGVVLRDGTALAGTLDRVAADHVDLAEHAPDEPRRAGAVRQVSALPLEALSALRPA